MKTEKYKTGTPTNKGSLGYYSLLEWWENEFSKNEKTYILENYKPMGGPDLNKGSIFDLSASVISFLSGLQSFFTNLADEVISEKILNKAESLIDDNIPILDIHFLYGSIMKHYYKKRNIAPKFYLLAKKYCGKQIGISTNVKKAFLSESWCYSLPRHMGYQQLAIILEKEKNYKEAIDLCLEASNSGWNSDWNKRIERLNKKLEKEV